MKIDESRFSRFDTWIFKSYSFSPRAFALYRIFFALFALFIIMPGHPPYGYYGFLNGLPGDFFLPPPGPMMLFGTFPQGWFFILIEAILVFSLLSLLIGWKTRLSSLTIGICFLLGNGFSYSLGKINHDLFLPLIPLVMLLTNWGAVWSLDEILSKIRPENQTPDNTDKNNETSPNWPVTLLTLFLGFMMFTAGFPKILGGWLNPGNYATYGHLINQYFVNDRTALLSEYFLNLELPVFWMLIDYVTIFFEIGFLFAIIKSKYVRLFCSFAVLFHFGVMIMLNISFIPNLTIYSLFLFNWEAISKSSPVQNFFNKIYSRENDLIKKLPFKTFTIYSTIFILISLSTLILLILGSPLNLLNEIINFDSDLHFLEVVILTLYVPVAALVIINKISKKRFHKSFLHYFG